MVTNSLTSGAGEKEAKSTTEAPRVTHEFLLREALRNVNKNNPIQVRLRFVAELCEFATTYR